MVSFPLAERPMELSPAWLAVPRGLLTGLTFAGPAPRAAPCPATARALRASPPPAPGSSNLPGAGLALLAGAATWAAGRRGAGRVVVFGRNYETNIKKKKGPAEARKARLARKHLNKIVLCLRDGGADEEFNPALKRQIRMALKDNVPRSTIDKRIKRFVEGKETFLEMTMGGYGAGGTAVMVQCATDSNVRTRTDVREAFKAGGGQIGTEGCVDHLFNKQGILRFKDIEEEALVETSMEADIEVEDVVAADDGSIEVITLPENFHGASKAFEEQGLEPAESDVMFKPVMTSELSGANAYEFLRLLHLLEEIDDVQDVHHGAILPEGLELTFNAYGLPLTYEQLQKVK